MLLQDVPAAGDGGTPVRVQGVRVRVLGLEYARLRQVAPVRGHSGRPAALSQRGLQPDDAAQPAGARDHGRGEAAGQQLGASGAQELPPGHAGLPVLALCSRVPGAADLPVPLDVRGREGRLRPHHGGLRLSLAGDAHL